MDITPSLPGSNTKTQSLPKNAPTPTFKPKVLALAAKVRALLDGRFNVSFEDVRRVYLPSMRHRTLLNFEAQAEGIEIDQVLLEILEKVPEKSDEVLADAV